MQYRFTTESLTLNKRSKDWRYRLTSLYGADAHETETTGEKSYTSAGDFAAHISYRTRCLAFTKRAPIDSGKQSAAALTSEECLMTRFFCSDSGAANCELWTTGVVPQLR